MHSLNKKGYSLRTQIISLIVIFSCLFFVTSLFITLEKTRAYVETQLGVHAQDAAVSLGLSISPHLENDDIIFAQTFANAIFDSGYYQYLEFIPADTNKEGFKRTNPATQRSTPAWFSNTFLLTAPIMETEVSAGWVIAGTLYLQSNTGDSYQYLWEEFIALSLTYLIFTLVFCVIAIVIIIQIVKPLELIANATHNIEKNKFEPIRFHSISREAHSLKTAFNAMALRLHKIITELNRQIKNEQQKHFLDDATKLPNRESFNNFWQAEFNQTHNEAFDLVMVQIDNLKQSNAQHGYLVTNTHLNTLVKQLKEGFDGFDHSEVYRLNGTDFVIVLQGHYPSEQLQTQLQTLTQFIQHEFDLFFSLYSADSSIAYSQVLSNLDNSDKYKIEANDLNLPQNSDTQHALSDWKSIIKTILDQGEMAFSRSVVVNGDKKIIYQEKLAILPDQLNTLTFINAAKQLGFAQAFDELCIKRNLNTKQGFDQTYTAINLLSDSICSASFIEFLKELSTEIQDARIMFEINNQTLINHAKETSDFVKYCNSENISICLENVGNQLIPVDFISQHHIDFIKVSPSLIQQHQSEHSVIPAIILLANSLNIHVICPYIENQTQFEQFKALHFDAYQGYHFNHLE
jgi:diguanylate cyclase (GGDEF)-like protein